MAYCWANALKDAHMSAQNINLAIVRQTLMMTSSELILILEANRGPAEEAYKSYRAMEAVYNLDNLCTPKTLNFLCLVEVTGLAENENLGRFDVLVVHHLRFK